MSTGSAIEWTEATWNPITGCTKVSLGCKNCYAERMAKRLKSIGVPNYKNEFEVTLHPNVLELPLKWKKPQMIFVNSMSDLFQEDVPLNFIQEVFNIMSHASHHIFQVLTKRAKRLEQLKTQLPWPKNVWMGVSIENDEYLYRINHLVQTPAKTKFISLEPLLGPLSDLTLKGIDWVIVGGESGPKARQMEKEWVKDIRDRCLSDNIPFFFKQWGGVNKKKAGRTLEGKIWNEMPRNYIFNLNNS